VSGIAGGWGLCKVGIVCWSADCECVGDRLGENERGRLV
jgi:hypothetical protein